ncbi:mRNA transport regulator MTR10 [Sporobolomyces koalae]|uniref:mRNA transport regulator MTR10 n=1 Tax=Sporobolomyces koalae TaxID=500713 RepID=UPI003172FA78
MSATNGDTGAAIQQVVQALNVLYQNPDPIAKEKANTWLGEFQKSNEAWATSQLILFAEDAPVEPKLFAAQTFRMKITYDLEQLPEAQLLPLRDSLLTALRNFASGPRVILTQLCIALADLALQLSAEQWDDPTAAMIDMFGKEPNMAAALLEFLQVEAEEFSSNFKIQVKNDFGREGDKTTKRGEQVIALLSMYVQAPGITAQLQNQCFATLGAWLRTGQLRSSWLAGTPILAAAFAALSNDELFDNAVDVLVDVIHETQELQENVAVIQEIVPRLNALQPNLADPDVRQDEDKMRGYCRVLVEAGEWYEPLMPQHPETFLPLVQLISSCAAYEELEVVGITLNFWYRLSKGLSKMQGNPAIAPLLQVFVDLVGIVIRHLHYPDDSSPLSGEERDTFRDFRHKIGDTLKDCCAVLGAGPCLQQAFDAIARAVAAGGAVRWQDVEAPLFSMRSMGAAIDVNDNEIVPKIMEILPNLPQHPRIRYAAILVIGRYTHWTEQHPEHIQFQLPYISSGFDDSDPEVLAAASQTMKYLCKDCSWHLIPFLPQLHTFIQTVSTKLAAEDLLDLTAAIAHIIVAMPPAEIPQTLSTFAMPNLEIVHAVVQQPNPASQDDLRKACDALERIDLYLSIVERLSNGIPPECASTCSQAWSIIDAFLAKYGSNAMVAEKTCVAIRRGLTFFEAAAFEVAPAVLERMATSFEQAAASSYLWITGKVIGNFAYEQDPAFKQLVQRTFERESNKLFEMLQTTQPVQISDVIDDYTHLVRAMLYDSPDEILLSSAFPAAFQSVLTALTLLTPQIVLTALDALRDVIGHEALGWNPANASQLAPYEQAKYRNYVQFQTAIRAVVEASAIQLVQLLLDVLVAGGEDEPHSAITILRMLSIHFPTVLAANVPVSVEQLVSKAAAPAEKAEFLVKFNAAITAQDPAKCKDAFTWLFRTSRKSRERARDLEDRR